MSNEAMLTWLMTYMVIPGAFLGIGIAIGILLFTTGYGIWSIWKFFKERIRERD